ncbi:hypothetical protein IFM89_023590 [Coptis chinensis]|uniref:Uncharacterized protein n=1 Tax=Coptis chinensis TaxID=261450 RepID=A0A835HJH9_9MAGN|nr:hypothetical protein IFM89_023590 [Coptis chinensis]
MSLKKGPICLLCLDRRSFMEGFVKPHNVFDAKWECGESSGRRQEFRKTLEVALVASLPLGHMVCELCAEKLC